VRADNFRKLKRLIRALKRKRQKSKAREWSS